MFQRTGTETGNQKNYGELIKHSRGREERPNKFERKPSRIGCENLTDGMKIFIFGKTAD